MGFLRNRTVLGIICIMVSLLICFAVTPFFNANISRKTSIVHVAKDIKAGEQITGEMIKTVEVGSYNLPQDVVKSPDIAVGRYAVADLLAGDYILAAKLADAPPAENAALLSLNGEKQAFSLTIKSFAAGLSGKLISGDIVSVIAPDYKKRGTTVIPAELQYVEVIAVTAGSGYDTDTAGQRKDDDKELPSTVTLLVSPEQSKILAELDAEGKPHLSLVYRGSEENKAKFIEAQDAALKKLYPEAANHD